MTATNHALTGALIGLSVTNPGLAVPLAFASHFVLDALPHYDPPGNALNRLRARRFKQELWLQALLCLLIVLVLAATQPIHWFLAAICAFAAASPDLFWLPKFISANRDNELPKSNNLFWKFHSFVQWKARPQLLWFEFVIFLALGFVLFARL